MAAQTQVCLKPWNPVKQYNTAKAYLILTSLREMSKNKILEELTVRDQ